jgi:hypothetical protein
MSDPIKEINRWVREWKAAECLSEVETEHRRKYVKIMCNSVQYEPIRQAVCSGDPQMESAVMARSGVPMGQVYFMDTSVLDNPPT